MATTYKLHPKYRNIPRLNAKINNGTRAGKLLNLGSDGAYTKTYAATRVVPSYDVKVMAATQADLKSLYEKQNMHTIIGQYDEDDQLVAAQTEVQKLIAKQREELQGGRLQGINNTNRQEAVSTGSTKAAAAGKDDKAGK